MEVVWGGGGDTISFRCGWVTTTRSGKGDHDPGSFISEDALNEGGHG